MIKYWRCLLLVFMLLSIVAMEAYAEKSFSRDEVIPTLESSLQELTQVSQLQAKGLASSLGIKTESGRIRVAIEFDDSFVEGDIVRLGGTIVAQADAIHLLEVDIPITRLLDLARLPGVKFVRQPYSALPADGAGGETIVSEGVKFTGAEAWHSAGFRGQGVTVAVIDIGFKGLSKALAKGELDHVIYTHDYTGDGMEAEDSDEPGHGVACAEIVHEMAPDAKLILMKAWGAAELENAVSDAIAQGADIITHSVLHLNSNFYDGTGPFCHITEEASGSGVLWVNCAGNSGAGSHWEGDWRDSNGDGWLDFVTGDEVNKFHLDAGKRVEIWLTWDAWPQTNQDYDLYLVDSTGRVVASSKNWQTGTQEPTERLYYKAENSMTLGIKIHAASAPSHPRLELYCYPWETSLEYSVKSSSIPAPGNSPSVLTVGGVPTWAWTDGGPAYWESSRGPSNISRNNSHSLTKPDICGPTGVSGTIYGQLSDDKGFWGTSASAPHVAGAAALVWSAHTKWSMETVRQFLQGNAIDRGIAGKDDVYGYGQLYLPPPGGKRTIKHSYGVKAGWYLVSRPLLGGEANPFHTTAYSYDCEKGRYVTVASVEQSGGYWVYLPRGTVVTDFGAEATLDVRVKLETSGWHLIGVPWKYSKGSIQVANGSEVKAWADAVNAGWVDDGVYGYSTPDKAYYCPSILSPWIGYWIKAKEEGISLVFLASKGILPSTFSLEPIPDRLVNAPFDLPSLPPSSSGFRSKYLDVWCSPNPVLSDNKVWFEATLKLTPEGKKWIALRDIHVEVYDLSGRLVWNGYSRGESYLEWDLRTSCGDLLANGVYLYRLWTDIGGEKIVSGIGKLVVLR